MNIRRLGWAGLELEADGHTAVIDLLEDATPLAPFIGPPRTPLPPPSNRAAATLALVTHLHTDHTDAQAIARTLKTDGLVLRPATSSARGLEAAGTAEAEAALAETGVLTRIVAPWETVTRGPFTVTAVPAVDGFGDPQVSWVIEAAGRRMLHAGDTVFHGHWWSIANRCGPIDVAFLPVNGAVCDLPHRQPPSPFPAVLDPRHAAVAASLLRARLTVPIHYDTLHNPPVYAQVDAPAATFLAEAQASGIRAHVLEPGEHLQWDDVLATASAS